MSVTENPLEEGETDVPNVKEEGSAGTPAAGEALGSPSKVQSEEPLGTFLARAQQARDV